MPVRFKYYSNCFIFGGFLEIVAESKNEIETTLGRIMGNENRVIKAHPFFSRILRKTDAYEDETIAKSLLDDFKIINGNREAEFEYASKNMLNPEKQFKLEKLDKFYGKGYLENLLRLENSGYSINQLQSSLYMGNFAGQTVYVCTDVPHTESNMAKAEKVVEIAIKSLSEKLAPKKELL